MGRVNKYTAGVFSNIVGNEKEKPTFEQFLGVQDLLSKPTDELEQYLMAYRYNVNKNKDLLDKLAALEEIIMQMRTRDNIDVKDIRLNMVREYIYARIPFRRSDKDNHDLRVIVGMTEKWGNDIKKLTKNKKLLECAIEKLTLTMTEYINENIKILNSTWIDPLN